MDQHWTVPYESNAMKISGLLKHPMKDLNMGFIGGREAPHTFPRLMIPLSQTAFPKG